MPCSRGELLRCAHRVFHAVAIIQQVTTMHYLRRSGEQVRERESRLRAFNRTVSHELKNRIGAIRGAHSLLREPWIDAEQRERLMSMIGDNTRGLQEVLDDLVELSRLDGSPRQQRNVRLPRAAAEDRKSTRLNSSHANISYAVFCLKKKKTKR